VYSSRYLPKVKQQSTDAVLTAAKGTPIPVRGETRLSFSVLGKPFHVDILVSDQVDKFILGLDWLEINNASWHFADGI
jgi:hypothetical protein